MMPEPVYAASNAPAVSYIHREWNGSEVVESRETCDDYTLVENGTHGVSFSNGWYVFKANVTKVKTGKKLATGHAAKLRFKSNNTGVATVSAKGKVTAKSKGTCLIYVQTINGIWKTVKVTVK